MFGKNCVTLIDFRLSIICGPIIVFSSLHLYSVLQLFVRFLPHFPLPLLQRSVGRDHQLSVHIYALGTKGVVVDRGHKGVMDETTKTLDGLS